MAAHFRLRKNAGNMNFPVSDNSSGFTGSIRQSSKNLRVWQASLARLPGYHSITLQNNQGFGKLINQITGFPSIDDNRTSTIGLLRIN